MELVCQYVQAIQALICAGANVHVMLRGRSVGVLSVEVGDGYGVGYLRIGYSTPASPFEQQIFVSLATTFTVVFDDWPQEVVQARWYR